MPFVETRYGLLSVPDIEEDVVGRFLARYGEWAWDEVVFTASVLPESARVLDLGAFVGTFGLGLDKLRPLGALTFVEANPQAFAHLSANAETLARAPTVSISALVAAGGTAAAPGRSSVPGNFGATSFAAAAAGEIVSAPPERVLTLAELRTGHGPFDLVKLDLEGMESEVLASDAAELSKGRTTLWLECNENQVSLDVAAMLLDWGLDLYYFAFPSYNPNNLRNDPDPIYPFAYEAGLLAAPKVPPKLEASLIEHACMLTRIATIAELEEALWRTPRWGMREWLGAKTSPEFVALAGRSWLGQDRHSFLDGWASAAEQTLDREDAAPAAAGLRLSAVLAELEAERSRVAVDAFGIDESRRRIEQAAAAAAKAQDRFLEALQEVGTERSLRRRAERTLEEAERRGEALSKALKAAEAQEAGLRKALAAADERQAGLSAAAQVREASAAAALAAAEERLAAELRAAQAQVELLRRSASWRLTAPLRVPFPARQRLRRLLGSAARSLLRRP
ncbi:FkbM family methyltransferase [Chelatococcus reniformis]|uniref:Methyltransferase FkbM domain-containing protein n=1 Tax=Chelatococcus reniformis TaxID=1494448 RepID=A0A916UD09_9HYPH|nr:FkbM family methyltransferase [Chelatococcus reniformis]GGC67739.1 hypothetical protein GCM10010994_27930 [Chelatococcus reniformis]